jgi:hypothetical protein
MLEFYQDCNSEYDNLEHFRYIPSNGYLTIIYGRCSAHYNRNLDELWYFKKNINIEKWTDRLSEIGKKKLQN